MIHQKLFCYFGKLFQNECLHILEYSHININITDHGFLRYSQERYLTFWCHINGLPQRLHPHLTLTQITYFTSSWMIPYKLAGNVVDLPLISDPPIPAFAASVDTMLRNSVASGILQTSLGPSPPISKERKPTKCSQSAPAPQPIPNFFLCPMRSWYNSKAGQKPWLTHAAIQ